MPKPKTKGTLLPNESKGKDVNRFSEWKLAIDFETH